MNLDEDDIIEHFRKHRYYNRFDEKNWREELEQHPLLMSKPPSNPEDIPPLVEAIRQLKYGEEENTPEELAKQYKIDGNENYKQKRFIDAIANYKKGLDYLFKKEREEKEIEEIGKEKLTKSEIELKSVLYSNLAACHFMMKNYNQAINDCVEALRINRENQRAKQRMADALKAVKSQNNKLEDNEEIEEGTKVNSSG